MPLCFEKGGEGELTEPKLSPISEHGAAGAGSAPTQAEREQGRIRVTVRSPAKKKQTTNLCAENPQPTVKYETTEKGGKKRWGEKDRSKTSKKKNGERLGVVRPPIAVGSRGSRKDKERLERENGEKKKKRDWLRASCGGGDRKKKGRQEKSNSLPARPQGTVTPKGCRRGGERQSGTPK